MNPCTDKKDKIIFILGPTASGKSEAAVYLAERINAEIISCDSMQVYKGMKVITSRPPQELTRRVRHHLLAKVALDKEYDASLFRKDALKKIKEIIEKGRKPLVVGGTGLYASILINGIFQQKAGNSKLRKSLYKISKHKGSAYLHKELAKVDPESAVKIHPNDAKRIIRALEVYRLTGKRISVLQKNRRSLMDKFDVRVFCLNMPRDLLYKRIDSRVDKMLKSGLINEVRRLLKKQLSRTASFAIGIKEVGDYLKGLHNRQEAIDMIKLNTRRYAKRQLTWFRKDKSAVWIDIGKGAKPREIAGRIYRYLKDKDGI